MNFTPAEVIQMLVWYSAPENGNGPVDWVNEVFPDAHPAYRAEKVFHASRGDLWGGFIRFYATLDNDNREKLIAAMVKRYGADIIGRRLS
jgi:hypothetical protein